MMFEFSFIFVFFRPHLKDNWNTCHCYFCCDWCFYPSRFIRNSWTGSCMFFIIKSTKKIKKKKKKSSPNQTTFISLRHPAAGQFTSLPACWMRPDVACFQVHSITPAPAAGVLLQNWSLAPTSKEVAESFFCLAFVQVSPTCMNGESVCWSWCQKPVNTKIKILQLLISCAHEPDSLWTHGSY